MKIDELGPDRWWKEGDEHAVERKLEKVRRSLAEVQAWRKVGLIEAGRAGKMEELLREWVDELEGRLPVKVVPPEIPMPQIPVKMARRIWWRRVWGWCQKLLAKIWKR